MKELLQQALDALEQASRAVSAEHVSLITEDAITALRAAIAQGESEPVGEIKGWLWVATCGSGTEQVRRDEPMRGYASKQPLYTAPVQTESKPYGWMVSGVPSVLRGSLAKEIKQQEAKEIGGTCKAFPVYTTPVQPAYVPLTDARIDAITVTHWNPAVFLSAHRAYARDIERAVRGEK